LIGDSREWPRIGFPWFVVHGRLRDGGDLSLLGAWVKHATPTNEATSVSASTLALGDHIDPDMRWSQVIYSTANLSEWRRDTGLSHKLPAPRTGPARFRVDWRPPSRDQVRVPGGALIFYGTRNEDTLSSPEHRDRVRGEDRNARQPGCIDLHAHADRNLGHGRLDQVVL
jgi:hypothetical protein